MESELDQIMLGNRKLHFNIPKYRRTQKENERYGRRVLRNVDVGRHRGGREGARDSSGEVWKASMGGEARK